MQRVSTFLGILALALGVVVLGNSPVFAQWENGADQNEVLRDFFIAYIAPCIAELDFELENALDAADAQSAFGTRDWLETAQETKDECELLLEEALEGSLNAGDGLLELIDTVDDLIDLRADNVDEEVAELVAWKVYAELHVVWGWIALTQGTFQAMNEIIDELSNCFDDLEDDGACDNDIDDIIDVAEATPQQAQAAGVWANIYDTINRLIGWKVLVEGGLFFNDQLGVLDTQGFNFAAAFILDLTEEQTDCLQGNLGLGDGGLGWGTWCFDPETGEPIQDNFAGGLTVSTLAAQELTVEKTYASPNPASLGKDSQVTFVAEGQGISQVQVEIYDLAGGLVYNSGLQSGNALSWNLLNGNGQSVANGVYLYVVTAKGTNGQVVRNEVQKLVVLK